MLRTASLLPVELFQLATASGRRSQTPAKCFHTCVTLRRGGDVQYKIGYAFSAKPPPPPEPSAAGSKGGGNKKQAPVPRQKPPRVLQGFEPGSPVAKWRDEIVRTIEHERDGKKAFLGAGHDFLFSRHVPDEKRYSLGVADGVGGWEDQNCDPAVFAQALCWHAHEACPKLADPGAVLDVAYENVLKDPSVVAGSSTACFASLYETEGKLKVANLGDSTFLLLRGGKVVHSQRSQTHFFNAPRQLAKLPEGANPDGMLMDSPSDADRFEAKLKPGDFVVFATDGFSDNVWGREVEQVLEFCQNQQRRTRVGATDFVRLFALTAVNYARACSQRPDKHSPFAAEAARYGLNLPGGKVDDCTVIVVSVHGADEALL